MLKNWNWPNYLVLAKCQNLTKLLIFQFFLKKKFKVILENSSRKQLCGFRITENRRDIRLNKSIRTKMIFEVKFTAFIVNET